MSHLLLIPAWALLGAGLGLGVRWASVYLARVEDLSPGGEHWQRLGPPLLAGLLFGLTAWRIGPTELLLIKSLWMLVLVQVIFFDLEHRLILDRVLLPAMLAAIVLSIVTPELGSWWGGRLRMSMVTGLGAGVLFLAIALLGAAIFRAEALGFGDVKLSVFIGLILGFVPTFRALTYGILIAGVAGVLLIVVRRRARGMTFAYGPYLAAGAIIMLLQV